MNRRSFGQDRSGRDFSPAWVRAVWGRGRTVRLLDPNEFREDIYGNPIRYSHYGQTASALGWEIDHVVPVARGGSDDLRNLQPLQWRANRRKGDS
jgi:hypothetical protein